MKDKTVEKTELIIKVLEYAEKHKLDIQNKEEVKKILEVLDPGKKSEEEIATFMELLQHADTFMTMEAVKKSKKIKVSN